MDHKDSDELYLEKELLAPFTYLFKMKGKRRFLNLFFTFNHWLKVPAEKIAPLWELANMLYVSCLLCDDVQDNTNIRGVLPATHRIYGVPRTLNASIHSLLLILDKAANLCPEACKIIIEEYLETFRGQGTEIYWRDNFICPTEEQFRKMSIKKTGRFFMVLVRLMQFYSENKTDYSKLVFTLTTFIQINDDYCNLNYQEGLEGWPENEREKVYNDVRFCEDITEAKFTLPIIHAMQTEYADEIMNILRQRTRDVSLKKYCVSLIEKAGGLEYARKAMLELEEVMKAEVARHGGNPELEAVFEELLGWKS